MSLYTALCSRVLFPVHERIKGHDSVGRMHRLESSQWWSAEALREAQARRLNAFLVEIGERVPYYRALFQRLRFDAAGVQSTRDLAQLPLLTKSTIRDNVEGLMARDHGPLTRYNTGGSSGEPLIFYIGKSRKSHDVAAKWRATRWWGVDIGDKELVVWGSPVELNTQDRIKRLRDGIMRSHLLPAFEMSPENLDHFVRTIRDIRPTMLFGYPSSLSLIGQHAHARGVRLDDLGIKVAFVTSERLYDEQRTTITDAFGCPVANGYGARDAGFIAHECPSGKLHICAEDLVVETVRPDGSATSEGEAGEIVVTHMATTDFPFVRYRTGDVGMLSDKPCDCGRGLPILQEVQGRTTDFVVARDGTIMHGLALIYSVRDLPGVERFKVEQMTLDHTVVHVVASDAFGEAQASQIVRDFKERLGRDVRIEVLRVAQIANERSGKFRYVVSHVKPAATSGSGLRA